ncbi:hypothetical protein HYV85_04830 [Candidatus Woesearchaeota archaeon]|nr:hypothetical protein [Candidatus Woesearchaeota archaeon]
MFNLWKSVIRDMDPMEIMRSYLSLSRISERVGGIAAGRGAQVTCDLGMDVMYLCESTKTPAYAKVAQLAKAFGCKLKRFDGTFNDDDFQGKGKSYTFVHGDKGTLDDYFRAGVIAFDTWPGLLAVHHGLTSRKDDLINLLDGIAVLYGLEKAADLNKYRPADDIGLPGSARTQLPKPFRDHLNGLGG